MEWIDWCFDGPKLTLSNHCRVTAIVASGPQFHWSTASMTGAEGQLLGL